MICGIEFHPWSNIRCITWTLVRNVNSCTPSQIYKIRDWRRGLAIYVYTDPPVSPITLEFEKHHCKLTLLCLNPLHWQKFYKTSVVNITILHMHLKREGYMEMYKEVDEQTQVSWAILKICLLKQQCFVSVDWKLCFQLKICD